MKPGSRSGVKPNWISYRMSKRIVLLSIIIFLMFEKTSAQDPIFSQHYANPLYLNPAFAGSKKCTRINLNYRNQPFPVFGTYSTYSFSADHYSQAVNGGIGLSLVHDSQGGLLEQSQAGIMYAWQSSLSRNWSLSLAFQASWLNYRINPSRLVFPDQMPGANGNTGSTAEPMLQQPNSHNVDFSTGFLIFTHQFYSGIAVHHIGQPTLLNYEDQRLPAKFTLMAGYDFSKRQRRTHETSVKWSSNIVIQSQSQYLRFNYGIYAQAEQLTAGVWFRHSVKHPNSLIFMVGLKQVNYTIGYSYDYTLSGFSGKFGGAHEIGVLLNFNCAEPNMKYRILNCPTF